MRLLGCDCGPLENFSEWLNAGPGHCLRGFMILTVNRSLFQPLTPHRVGRQDAQSYSSRQEERENTTRPRLRGIMTVRDQPAYAKLHFPLW